MLTDAAREDAATAVGVTHLGLANSYPGADGESNEEAGGSYARQPTTPTITATGTISCADGPFNFTVDGTIEWVTAHDDLSAGEPKGILPLGGTELLYCVDVASNVFDAPGHGLSDDELVVFYTSVPAPLTAGTKYWVVNATTNTFQVSATMGGAAIDITAQASDLFRARVSRIVPDSGTTGRTVSLGLTQFNMG